MVTASTIEAMALISGVMPRSLTEASFDLFATPLRTFVQVTLPQLRPAIVAGALLAFTFSFDDFVIATFVAGPGQPTLPMYIFSSIRRGITPEINAIASMVLAVTITALVTVGLVYRRQARQAGETAAEPLARGIGEDACRTCPAIAPSSSTTSTLRAGRPPRRQRA